MNRVALALAVSLVVLSGCQQASANDEGTKVSDFQAAKAEYTARQVEQAEAVASQVGRWTIVPTKANEPTMILDTITGCVFAVQTRGGTPVIREPALEISRQTACRLGDPVATVSAK